MAESCGILEATYNNGVLAMNVKALVKAVS
jgi:hypothetical protein